jgi:CO dehydrogenase nickel-insertion accessory protein CooC1
MFVLTSGSVATLIAKASSLEKISAEKIGEYEILIIDADTDLNQGLVIAMEPKVVILYGEKAKEGAKKLGKEAAVTSSKIALAEDKLPEEMDVMLLG